MRTIAPVSKVTIGLFAINSHACAEPEAAARIAKLAEELGYDSLWAGEHVVVPSPRVDPSPMEPDEPILDPLIALAHLAGHTERILLGTGLIVLPQRNPLVLAKQAASLDVLCGGRLILGIGVGYLEPELTAIGVPMEKRGARADEYLAAMRSLWDDDAPAHHGESSTSRAWTPTRAPSSVPCRSWSAGTPRRPSGARPATPTVGMGSWWACGRWPSTASRSSAPAASGRCTCRSRHRARSTPTRWPPTRSWAWTG